MSEQLISVQRAAQLLSVSDRTIRRWIEDGAIPHLVLPGGRGYRIPQGALLASLRGNYDLAAELAGLDQRHTGVSEEDVKQPSLTDRKEQ